jgi:23S rRNA pseudouridine1911/1915/1917 synthase
VLVDGAERAKSHRLGGGEELEFEVPERRESVLVPEPVEGLRVAYEDEHLLVVDKPAGVVVHPSAGHDHGTVVHGLLAREIEGGEEPERPGIVHRLDRDTSGLLVVARSDEAHRRLQRLLRRRKLVREYLVLVRGRPLSRAGRVEAPIGRDRHDPTRHSLDTATPREAATTFEVLELLPRHTLLRVGLETGRTHQIRVHLAAVDLLVAGDPTYGAPGDLGLERQFLHAARLAVPHPFTGDEVDVSSPLPADLAGALDMARTGDASLAAGT